MNGADLRDLLSLWRRCSCYPGDTLFEVDSRVVSSDFIVYSAYWNRQARCLFLLVKRTIGVKLDTVYVDAVDRGWNFTRF